MTPTDERIARLPRWARAYIEGLEDRIDRDGSVDLRPGAINSIVQTRSEVRNARMVDARTVDRYSMSAAAAGRELNAKVKP